MKEVFIFLFFEIFKKYYILIYKIKGRFKNIYCNIELILWVFYDYLVFFFRIQKYYKYLEKGFEYIYMYKYKYIFKINDDVFYVLFKYQGFFLVISV